MCLWKLKNGYLCIKVNLMNIIAKADTIVIWWIVTETDMKCL